MFFNNFINNIIKSMMAVCVVANGWSMNGEDGVVAGINVDNVETPQDSPISITTPPLTQMPNKDTPSPARTDDTVWKETKILGIGARLSRDNQDIKALEALDKLTESDSTILTQAVYDNVNIFPTLLKCINLLQGNSGKLKNLMKAIVSSSNYFSDDEDNAGDIENLDIGNLLIEVVEKTDEY